MLRDNLRIIKKTIFWKFFIQNIFYPIYNIFWQYILNFEAKILYFLWMFKKKDFINLTNKNSILVTNNQTFKSIARKISNETIPLMEISKKKSENFVV